MTGSEIIYCANGCTRTTPEGRTPATTEPPSQLCPRCEHNLQTWVKEIPDRYALLPHFIAHGTVDRNPEAKTGRNVVAPAPMRLEIIDLLDGRHGRQWSGIAPKEDRRGAVGTLHAPAQQIREAKKIAPELNPTVAGEAAFLSRWLLWLCEQEWVSDAFKEIKKLHNQLGDAIGERRTRPVGTCVVETEDGDETGQCGGPLFPSLTGGVYCARCQDSWDIDELRRLGLLLGQETPA